MIHRTSLTLSNFDPRPTHGSNVAVPQRKGKAFLRLLRCPFYFPLLFPFYFHEPEEVKSIAIVDTAGFAGKRLPTEAEWEKAALWDPKAGRARRYPWGDEPPGPRHANLDQLLFEPAPIGAYPEGVSAYGVHQMVGDVWEWTSSDFVAYPGFAAFPYREYSEIFFGDEYKVLRGGSCVSSVDHLRPSYRNFFYPEDRWQFSGIRLAKK